MSVWMAYLVVFLAAAIPWLEVLIVVPAGILAGLPPVPTAVVGAIGNIVTLVPLVIGGDRLRSWWRRRSARRVDAENDVTPARGRLGPARDRAGRPGDAANRPVAYLAVPGSPDGADGADGADDDTVTGDRGGRARRVFDRFGLPGLALVGPVVTGIHVAAIVGLAAGTDRRRTLGWLIGGVVVWSFAAAGATVLGIEALVDPTILPDLFG